MKTVPLYTVDAFTTTMFGGNQAAVCLIGNRIISESTMQSLASEMNISDTAYLESDKPADEAFKTQNKFKIRCFSPTNEISLCGHATLASAAVIFNECGNVYDEITFYSSSGNLIARKGTDGITLDFPSNEPDEAQPQRWATLLRATLVDTYDDVEKVLIAWRMKCMLVVLNDKHAHDQLRSVNPNFREMVKAEDGSVISEVIVTTRGTGDYDFISRFFCPWDGIQEDPVTGSAHTVLGPYWARVLNKNDLRARQCSKRGGDILVAVRGDRVHLTGSAVTVVRGSITLCC